MLQDYKILTVTHRNTSLKDIGQFAIAAEQAAVLDEKLEAIKQTFGFDELMYVATCNRVLFLFISEQPLDAAFVERFFLFVNPQLDTQTIIDNIRPLEGMAAVTHLYEVGGSIDSLVVGERQILGQLRDAFDQARTRGHIGSYLQLLVQRMVVASKDIYANTRIGEKPVSIVSLAVRKMFSYHLPTSARILLIGAGQTNSLIGKFLVKYHYDNVAVFNRSLDKAELLAEKVAGTAHPLSALDTYAQGFDCIIVCTGAPDPILTPALYAQLLNGEDPTGKIIVDLAIPHNTHPDVLAQYPTSTYIEIGGLKHLADENLAFREHEMTIAHDRLREHIEAFPGVLKVRQLELAMRSVPDEIKAVRQKAVNEVFRKDMEQLDDTTRALIDQMMTYMEKKCISIPMRVAKESLLVP